ncbi:MAG: hypothetical protein RIQ89_550 [Bacteroidota bacterium]|jgi:ferrous iron transport protein B
MTSSVRIALIGNPNSGKSTLFNALTGLNQKVANFPGVTVDKHEGKFSILNNGRNMDCTLVDLPGIYSLYPKSIDEKIAVNYLLDSTRKTTIDKVIVVIDASNIKRNLFLASQIIQLGLPTMLAVNMVDVAAKEGFRIDIKKLSNYFGVTCVALNARSGEGIEELKNVIGEASPMGNIENWYQPAPLPDAVQLLAKSHFPHLSNYGFVQLVCSLSEQEAQTSDNKENSIIKNLLLSIDFDSMDYKQAETLARYQALAPLVDQIKILTDTQSNKNFTSKIDRILTHKIGGYVIFLGIMFLMFQALFSWSAWPMEKIDALFGLLNEELKLLLPDGIVCDLITDGILAGLNGVLVFIPQICLLFFFIALLEDTGYMARVSFITDRLLKIFGLNGRSIIPLISGAACAVPAVMGARTIKNQKERLLTILVTPLMSCSARLPVYALMISLVIPYKIFYGFNLQGLVLMALYLIGFVAALLVAFVLKYVIKSKERSYFVMELPTYHLPRLKNIGLQLIEKIKLFVTEAGKVIIAISIVLWALASFGPGDNFKTIESKYTQLLTEGKLDSLACAQQIASEQLEASYAGHLGKLIEPIISPIGFDWKIGIALITSFAAREVFVGTMSTIYAADAENANTLKERLSEEFISGTNTKRYTLATGLSLMIFYAFAMQCMSTFAVVMRETNGFKWPLIQFIIMLGMAYGGSYLIYQLFS